MTPASSKGPSRRSGSTATPYVPHSLRIPFIRRCCLLRSRVEHDGLMLDLSLKGAYVATELLPTKDESLKVRFHVPGNDRLLSVSAVVAWVNRHQAHPVHSLPPGFGLYFLDPSPEDSVIITRAIQDYCRSNPVYRQYL